MGGQLDNFNDAAIFAVSLKPLNGGFCSSFKKVSVSGSSNTFLSEHAACKTYW